MDHEKPERILLQDGVFLNFVKNDRFKTNYVNVYFLTPLNDRTASMNTLLARVLLRGCAAYPTQIALNRALDDQYDAGLDSDTLKIGDRHALNLQLSVLDGAFVPEGEGPEEAALSILREVIVHPYLPNGAFDAAYVEGEKRQALDDLAARINQKARYARERMIEIMCKNEPYRTLSMGKASVLRAVTPEDLTAYYRTLLQTARVEIFFVGRFDRERIARVSEGFFADVERRYEPLPENTIVRAAKKVREVTETMPVSQANLVMGFRTGVTLTDPAWRALSVYNAVLGGSLTSKLFCILREKMSLCYSIHSFPEASKGILTIAAGIAAEKREIAIREALRQMDEIRRGNVTPEELESARGYLIGIMNGLWDNPAALAEWYLVGILEGKIQTPRRIVRELCAVTLHDVVEAAGRITTDTIYTLTTGEAKK